MHFHQLTPPDRFALQSEAGPAAREEISKPMAKKTFQAKLERPPGAGTWTFVTVPFNVQTEFKEKGQVRVKGTVNSIAFRGSLMPHGNGKHFLVVNRTIREQAGVKTGDTVKAVIERDTKARVVSLPNDFKRALARSAKAKDGFDKLAYSHKKAYVEWIESAKKAETRAKRIKDSLTSIAAGKRLKG
jgi:hypothetical protein